MKQFIKISLIAGVIIFCCSYGALYFGIIFFPDIFVNYISPVFNSDGTRDLFFYMHPFVLSFALAAFWVRFKTMFTGGIFVRGVKFGVLYAGVALIPVMWITYSAVDVQLSMVFSWLLYGLFQACIAGVVFAKLYP
ncbi:MAG: hypothetical protein IPM42_00240 [Saprospiraceae bacterium]|nr:hypothetical protein [Saprospiraceae bacterium]